MDKLDWLGFGQVLVRTAKRYVWVIHDYCLMSNHFHLVVQTLEPSLARGMQYLNGRHVSAFNAVHDRRGTLVQGRYYSRLITDDEDYLQVRGYLALNPVDAGLCREPEDWPWSGYGARGVISPEPTVQLRRFVAAYRLRRDRLIAMAPRDTSGL